MSKDSQVLSLLVYSHMKHLKAVFLVTVSVLAYYSYAHADGDGGRGGSGRHHSSDSTSHDSSRHDGSGGHDGSGDSTRHNNDTTEVRHGGDSTDVDNDSTEVRHGHDSTEVHHDSTDVRHGGDSTEVDHDSTEVRHGGDDSTHVGDHDGRGEDSTHVGDHRGRRVDSVRVDQRGSRLVTDDAHSSTPELDHRHGNSRSDTVRHEGEGERHGLIFARTSNGAIALGNDEQATFELFDLNGSLVSQWTATLNDVTLPQGLHGRFILVVRSESVHEAVKLQLDR